MKAVMKRVICSLSWSFILLNFLASLAKLSAILRLSSASGGMISFTAKYFGQLNFYHIAVFAIRLLGDDGCVL